MSLSAYARRRGVSVEAVSKAVERGRLRGSIVMVGGKPKIGDAELADHEWQANTRPRIDQPPPAPPPPKTTRERSKAKQGLARELEIDTSAEASGAADDSELPAGVPRYDVSRAVREFHAARREGALADVAEIERDKVREGVVPVEEVRAYINEKFTLVKNKLLGVPSRVAQRLPKLAKEVEPVVDELIREVLEELAAEDDGDGEEEAT
jgi:phage terminase Nu1 subunit (DNA packaging protein)